MKFRKLVVAPLIILAVFVAGGGLAMVGNPAQRET